MQASSVGKPLKKVKVERVIDLSGVHAEDVCLSNNVVLLPPVLSPTPKRPLVESVATGNLMDDSWNDEDCAVLVSKAPSIISAGGVLQQDSRSPDKNI
jgi:hypothetical protein